MDKLDVLNRDTFVEQLVRLMNNLSDNKSSTCFAINGAWGCGKSFLLDIFEERLGEIQSENTSKDKYFVVRYNSWKYDYYEEPLVAIVSTMISIVEEKTKLFPSSQRREEILGILKSAGVVLLSMADEVVKNKIGVGFQKCVDIVLTGKQNGTADYEDRQEYDIYFQFNKTLKALNHLLQEIAQEYTVVFLVDELDRCIPEYAIKVLERLHHLTEESTNLITIIAIDKPQLVCGIKKIFGINNPEKYLQKFINFEIKLDYGTVSERVYEKYAEFTELFDEDIFQFEDSVEECLQAIFKDIDIRTQEQLVKKAMLAHKLLYTEKKDYSFMCMELILVVMTYVHNYKASNFEDTPIDVVSFGGMFRACGKESFEVGFSKFFEEQFKKINFAENTVFPDSIRERTLLGGPNLYGAILLSWYQMHKKSSKCRLYYEVEGAYKTVANNYIELKKYVETLSLIV